MFTWVDNAAGDAVFGWRQLVKRKVTAAAAVLSLALAIGACVSAFRLIDALLFRPLSVKGADRLYAISFESPSATDGTLIGYDSCSYPMFRQMRREVRGQAEAAATSMYNGPADLTYGSDQEMERANLQYVSGWMFDMFGLRPAAGRLLHESDDVTPGAHPYATLSYDYWTRRFGRDARVVGRAVRIGNDVYQIIGVAEESFDGTEPGWPTDVWIPMAMKNPRTLASLNNFWLRTLFVLKPGVAPGPVEARLRATFRSIQEERVKGFPALSQRDRDRMFLEKLSLVKAPSGRSNLQRDYRQALGVIGLLAVLVLLIACANVANLLTAQAAARAREMALRVSIGASRWRLLQLALIESAWIALLATLLGAVFAWWSAPLIVRMLNPPAYAARLILPADWRWFGFALAIACGVTFLSGLAPWLRASSTKPMSVLRGEGDARRGRLMYALIATQVAFCFVAHLAAGLFVATFDRLSKQPLGFSSERILNLEAVTTRPQSPILWDQVASHLRETPGVESVALIGWPLMSGESAVGNISIEGAPASDVFADFVTISPGWLDLMRVPLLAGRDFRQGDVNPGVAIVNRSFARQYFNGENPVGKWFDRVEPAGRRLHIQVAGLVGDARSRDRMRIPIRPTAYIPFATADSNGALVASARGTFVVRTSAADPLSMAASLRQEVARARVEFRVRDARAQAEFNQTDTIRERLLAMLATFFAGVALLLAGVGLYGVLDHLVVERRKEIGIRIAIGARPAHVVRRVTAGGLVTIAAGGVLGLALGIACMRSLGSLLFEVKPTDPGMLALPAVTIAVAALLAIVPAVMRAIRIDPVAMLRAD